METKFLSDGRKVAIVGQLNNQETIVQEIFVTEQGDEIPSGERFVVKSLHDTPVETYLSRQKKAEEAATQKAKENREKIEREIKETRNRLSFYRDMLAAVKVFSDHINEQDFSHFINVMTGNVNYAVQDGYNVPEIKSIPDCMSQTDSWYGDKKYEGIRMLSVLGKSNGDISYNLNRYSDGSGNNTSVHFFQTYGDAQRYVKSIALAKLEKSYLGIEDLSKCKECGITFNQDEIAIIKERLISSNKVSLQNAEKDFATRKGNIEAELSKINSLLD